MRLKELRAKKNLYQKDIATMLGIDRTTYAKYETGDSEPNLETLLKLSEIFEVSTDYLLGREQKEKLPTVTDEELDVQDRRLLDLMKELTVDQKDFLLAQLLTLTEQGK